MDLKRYKKTRYQNIYKNIRNGNYLIVVPGTKNVISRDALHSKIFDIKTAISIRDDKKIKYIKSFEKKKLLTFDILWNVYIKNCEEVKRQEYNTIIKKERIYNRYFKSKFNFRISQITKYNIIKFLDEESCSLKQKNEMIKILRAFFTWCIEEEYLVFSPMKGIHNYKVINSTMKFWSPEEFKAFLDITSKDLKSSNKELRRKAYLTRILVLIGFNIGDRIGETRALTWSDIDEERLVISIKHSINYKPKKLFRENESFLGNTKTYNSQRDLDVTEKLINEIKGYKEFLLSEYSSVNDMIFYNYDYRAPYSSVTLRKYFNEYCKKANVLKIRMYDLRHTYVATMMAEDWELYHISLRLGHKCYSTTVNKYGHLSTNLRREIAECTDKYY